MALTPLKGFLFLGGVAVAAAGTAYVAGAFDPLVQPAQPLVSQPAAPPQATAPAEQGSAKASPDAAAPAVEAPAAGAPAAEVPAAEVKVAAAEPATSIPPAQEPAVAPQPPRFDLLRVEPDGSIVIAGSAIPGSSIDILSGSKVIGSEKVGDSGDFAVVLEDRLAPGDYQIVLRSTGPGALTLNSVETAIVSIPSDPRGQVLALVQQPGAPSKLITAPAAEKTPEAAASVAPATPEKPAEVAVAPPPAADAAKPAETEVTAAKPAAEPAKPAVSSIPATPSAVVVVEAVEIEGRKVFVAGSAPANASLRAYANAILLGDAKASPDGRFLIETERDLPVGDYVIRVDLLSKDGSKVLARAAVPFQREEGETVAAVAPVSPATPSTPAAEPVMPVKPSQPASVEQAGPAATSVDPSSAESKAASPADAPAQPPVAPEMTAPKLEASASGVIIRRGDTLWRISKRVYGRGTRYSTIYVANQDQIQNPNKIWPGQVFRVPDKSDQGESADMDAMKDQATTVQ
jgi:nucleoid-associated protein YgaU